jgi:predicted transcriptional regulator
MEVTKEIKFLIAIFEFAQEQGDVYSDVALERVIKKIGITKTSMSNIMNQLCGANFVKKRGTEFVCITDNGIRLVEQWI